ncbi:hypothetical protein COU88_02140, partial [Candidatus Roizmanbacteria bacterium CG10_big_fil_rev_8_21_14_0_10_39_6]
LRDRFETVAVEQAFEPRFDRAPPALHQPPQGRDMLAEPRKTVARPCVLCEELPGDTGFVVDRIEIVEPMRKIDVVLDRVRAEIQTLLGDEEAQAQLVLRGDRVRPRVQEFRETGHEKTRQPDTMRCRHDEEVDVALLARIRTRERVADVDRAQEGSVTRETEEAFRDGEFPLR